MQSLELVKSSELIMVFRISKIHTNADFTFSNNKIFEHSQLSYSHRNDFVLYWTWHKSPLYNGFLSIPLYQTG